MKINIVTYCTRYTQGYPEVPVLVQEKPILIPRDELEEERRKEAAAHNNNNNDSSFNVISFLQDFSPFGKKQQTATISATLPRLPINQQQQPSSPIAYVYTPTTPAAYFHRHRHGSEDKEEDNNEQDRITNDEDIILQPSLDRRDEKPVLLPSQQPSSSSSSAPSPQNFMAPFVASVSAEIPVKNGWSVVVAPTSSQQVNGTERTKNDEELNKTNNFLNKNYDEDTSINANNQENETQTERNDAIGSNKNEDNFDPEKFKPQIEIGGFKPIYEFPVDDRQKNDDEDTMMTGRATLVVSSRNNNNNNNNNKVRPIASVRRLNI